MRTNFNKEFYRGGLTGSLLASLTVFIIGLIMSLSHTPGAASVIAVGIGMAIGFSIVAIIFMFVSDAI